MYSNEPIVFKKERRKGADLINVSITLSTVIVWLVIFTMVLIVSRARPQSEMILDRLMDLKLRKHWDLNLMQYNLILLPFLFLFSSFAIWLNTKRLKRRGDRIRFSFILAMIISVIGFASYAVNFLA